MKAKFWIVIVLQIAVLLAIIGAHAYTLATGKPVLLKTLPVDPRSLFQGNYMELSYEISRVPFTPPKGTSQWDLWGKTVYVVLEKKGRYWQAVRASATPPELAPGQVLIKGTAGYLERGKLGVRYGIETLFISEKTAEEGGGRLSGQLDVEVAVTADGDALIKRIFLRGKQVPFQSR